MNAGVDLTAGLVSAVNEGGQFIYNSRFDGRVKNNGAGYYDAKSDP